MKESLENKVDEKERFDTVEEITEYIQQVFSDYVITAELEKESGIGYFFANGDMLGYFYEYPKCKFVLGPKKKESFNSNEIGFLILCKICDYRFERKVYGHNM